MSTSIEEFAFVVARAGKAIGSYYANKSDAHVELHRIEDSMRAALLEPDVYLATVTKTTTYGAPKTASP